MSENKRVPGTIDRFEGDIAVIIFKDPLTGKNREIDVNKKKLKMDSLKKGDIVLLDLIVETKIPIDGSMLEIEDAIEKAIEQVKTEVLKNVETRKKTPAKRARKT
jgi:hypothetical protein